VKEADGRFRFSANRSPRLSSPRRSNHESSRLLLSLFSSSCNSLTLSLLFTRLFFETRAYVAAAATTTSKNASNKSSNKPGLSFSLCFSRAVFVRRKRRRGCNKKFECGACQTREQPAGATMAEVVDCALSKVIEKTDRREQQRRRSSDGLPAVFGVASRRHTCRSFRAEHHPEQEIAKPCHAGTSENETGPRRRPNRRPSRNRRPRSVRCWRLLLCRSSLLYDAVCRFVFIIYLFAVLLDGLAQFLTMFFAFLNFTHFSFFSCIRRQGGDPLKRNEDDAAKLQAKVAAKKAAQEAAAGESQTKAPVVRKKVPKKTDDLDDMLSAGLTAGKKKAARAK